jgi:hypothetical protein
VPYIFLQLYHLKGVVLNYHCATFLQIILVYNAGAWNQSNGWLFIRQDFPICKAGQSMIYLGNWSPFYLLPSLLGYV